MRQIFPKEIIENTTEVYQFNHQTKSKIIYAIILLTLIITFLLLPFIKVEIFTTARGILKPSKERVSVTTLNSGRVHFVNLKNNQKVTAGDTLLILDNTVVKSKITLLDVQIAETLSFIEDCEYLVNAHTITIHNIQSSRYQKEFLSFEQKTSELQTRYQKRLSDHSRNKKLFNNGVIARLEFENSAFEYQLSINNLKQYQKQQKNTWQIGLTDYKKLLLEQRNQRNQLLENQKDLVVTAPVNGIIKNSKGLEKGSLINAGISLAEISPDTHMIAECYISPTNIGLLNKNKPVQLQVDAFNYNQWGLVEAAIEEVSKDIDMQNNEPVFTVKCNVKKDFLQLKNGIKGNLIKGMTFNARFYLTKRSIFDLLYDKVDDWLNPANAKAIAQIN